jgi:CheY-like chemotaxis protein
VADTGTGIDESIQQHMFEPFFTTKAEGRGTGMGLASVYGTIKSHRGMISVLSEVGKGTSIRIRLPVTRSAVEGKAIESNLRQSDANSLRVLLVDDEAVVRDVTTRLLVRLGCQVTSFENSFDAVKHYRESWQSVDVIMLDMVMPMLDGKATYQALRAVNPDAKVILVSGYSVDGDAELLLAQGAIDFVHKPFSLSNLDAALDRAMTCMGRTRQSPS